VRPFDTAHFALYEDGVFVGLTSCLQRRPACPVSKELDVLLPFKDRWGMRGMNCCACPTVLPLALVISSSLLFFSCLAMTTTMRFSHLPAYPFTAPLWFLLLASTSPSMLQFIVTACRSSAQRHPLLPRRALLVANLSLRQTSSAKVHRSMHCASSLFRTL